MKTCTGCGSENCSHLWQQQKKCCPDCSCEPPARGSGDFSIGSQVWPGTSKLLEEMGELQQVLGKLIATAGDTNHWSGDLQAKMIEEIGDVYAALDFFVEMNFLNDDSESITRRATEKFETFARWQVEQGK